MPREPLYKRSVELISDYRESVFQMEKVPVSDPLCAINEQITQD
jgi:hypothetical protein